MVSFKNLKRDFKNQFSVFEQIQPTQMLWNRLKLYFFFCFFFTDGNESQLEFDFDASMSVVTVRKPGMNAGADWTVTLQ